MIKFRDFVKALDSKSVRFLIIDEPSKSYVIYQKISQATSNKCEYANRYIDHFEVIFVEDGNTVCADIKVRLREQLQIN